MLVWKECLLEKTAKHVTWTSAEKYILNVLNRLIGRKPQHYSDSININVFHFADYWPMQNVSCFYELEMRNSAAHSININIFYFADYWPRQKVTWNHMNNAANFWSYHFQHFSCLLGRLARRVRYNVIPRTRREGVPGGIGGIRKQLVL